MNASTWWVVLGLAAMAAWWSGRRRSVIDGGLSVTGGNVSIDASNAVETRPVWLWSGPNIAGGTRWNAYWGKPDSQGVPVGAPIRLINGMYYDRPVSHVQPEPGWSWWTDAWGQPAPWDLGELWPTYWRRVILTAQEQIVVNVISVPQTIASQ